MYASAESDCRRSWVSSGGCQLHTHWMYGRTLFDSSFLYCWDNRVLLHAHWMYGRVLPPTGGLRQSVKGVRSGASTSLAERPLHLLGRFQSRFGRGGKGFGHDTLEMPIGRIFTGTVSVQKCLPTYWRAKKDPGTSVRLGNLRQLPIIAEVRLSIF